ncbi:MAG TPA: 5-bromo-4-chloroindolyl phosphate hydrolysis family protein [Candidatus Mediterraneibacter norfolkensis]|nr:5-bromo-4-chloroindolyl phosphate hydrolysis family protein [Candidatus Mediterraneibacter norfolkensis]
MINNEWERFGEDIRRTIQDAVDSRDFSRLNQTVSDTIGQAMDSVSRGLKNGGWYRGQPTEGNWGSRQAYTPGYDPRQKTSAVALRERKQMLYLKGNSARIGGAFLAATGYIFGIGAIALLVCVLIAAAAVGWGLALGAGAVVLGIAALIFVLMAGTGTSMLCSVGRFRKYVKILGDQEYCEVKELARQTGRSAKAVLKDLKKMIKKGWFRQGHLDEQGTCLMSSDEAYQQYTSLMERMKQQKAEREAAEEKARQEYSKLSPEVQQIIKAGDEYVKKIREANDAIPGEEISNKISRMEMLVDRIFDRVEQNPETVDDIHRLMDYYLPTTIKLLEAYEELDAQPVQGENIISSKQEIEKTLDTLNAAFEKLLDDLFQDTAWDVSSDISVLNMMLAQEGLAEDGLKKKK